jgi:DNA-binding HxlR family transcriptional regulator
MGVRRSACPINLTLETFGDRWSLIVLRDLMFGPHRTFRSLLAESLKGIASNILADRRSARPAKDHLQAY